MKTPQHFFKKCEELEDSDLFRSISLSQIAAIQSDAREGMVPVAELQAVEKERDEWRKTAGERLDLLTKTEGRALELLERLQRYETALQKLSVFRIAQEALQPAQKDPQ